MSLGNLKSYPRVKEIMEQVKEKYHGKTQGIEQRQEQLKQKVQEAIAGLKARGELVTQQSIGKYVGMTPKGLSYYPQIREMLEQVTDEMQRGKPRRFQQREDELVGKVEDAIGDLRTRGEPVTQVAISRTIGMTLNTLKLHPRVSAILAQVAEEGRRRVKKQAARRHSL